MARKGALEDNARGTRVYAEARSLDEVDDLLAVVPDRILLDNMEFATVGEAVQRIRSATEVVEIEATGGITLTNVEGFARAGVDFISIGALTHSAPALDLSLLVGEQHTAAG